MKCACVNKDRKTMYLIHDEILEAFKIKHRSD